MGHSLSMRGHQSLPRVNQLPLTRLDGTPLSQARPPTSCRPKYRLHSPFVKAGRALMIRGQPVPKRSTEARQRPTLPTGAVARMASALAEGWSRGVREAATSAGSRRPLPWAPGHFRV